MSDLTEEAHIGLQNEYFKMLTFEPHEGTNIGPAGERAVAAGGGTGQSGRGGHGAVSGRLPEEPRHDGGPSKKSRHGRSPLKKPRWRRWWSFKCNSEK